MATIEFDNDDVRRFCCDAAAMRARFGDATALRVSQRLQQIEAMASIQDVAFLPYDQRRVDRGLEITVEGDLVLLLSTDHEGVPTMNQPVITILGIHLTSAAPR